MSYRMYRNPPNSDLLFQGDILSKSSLDPSLVGLHDYIIDQTHFTSYIILTQTCDLDRNREMVDFIFLAVIRRLNDAFGRRHVENSKKRQNTTEVLKALYNHDVNKRALFYLPAAQNYGIDEDSVVDLRVLFSVHKASYPNLLGARCGGIEDIYAAKMGYIAGQMFNRVATPSWEDMNPPKANFSMHLKTKYTEIIDRENKQFEELQETESSCYFDGCKEKPSTYRWLPVRLENNRQVFEPHLLCADHAKAYEEVKAGRQTLVS